jgi:hypothetical protein
MLQSSLQDAVVTRAVLQAQHLLVTGASKQADFLDSIAGVHAATSQLLFIMACCLCLLHSPSSLLPSSP